MGGLEREYRAQRGFIDACEDVGALMTWMREYRDESRAAAGRGDRRASARYDDLAERAEDRVVELKAARRAAPLLARVKEWPAAPTPPPVDPEHEALRRQAEDAERRRVAAEERAARVQEEATRAAEAHPRELARLRAEELTRARVAPTPVHAAPSRPVVAPSPVAPARTKPAAARGAPVARPAPPAPAPEAEAEELTPLARLFQEAITETRPTRKAPSLPPKVTAALDPAPVPDELPLLTGANLASYRAWLGVSQRASALTQNHPPALTETRPPFAGGGGGPTSTKPRSAPDAPALRPRERGGHPWSRVERRRDAGEPGRARPTAGLGGHPRRQGVADSGHPRVLASAG